MDPLEEQVLGFVFNDSATVQAGYERHYGGYGYYGQKKPKDDEETRNQQRPPA